MSAIAALWNFDGRSVQDDLDRMLGCLAIYGRDRGGRWSDGDVGIGMRQMLTLPQDRFSSVIVRGGDGTLVMTADVRLDNRDALGRELGLSAECLRGLSDGQLVLRAYERWESECPVHLIGDFAFVVWDIRLRRLFCARDHMGNRPLFFCRRAHALAVASMPKGLFALADLPCEIYEPKLAEYLALAPLRGTQTLYRHVEQLPAGHRLTATAGNVTLDRYWRLDPDRRIRLRSDGAYVEAARELFEEAVRCRLRSVGPIGSHLSSGFDSSAVTATAARLLGNQRLHAFTAVPRDGFDGPVPTGRHADESPLAALVAADHQNIDHVLVHSDEKFTLDEMDRDFFLNDAPSNNPCNMVWWQAINAAAKQRGVKVLLIGQKGNLSLTYDGGLFFPSMLAQGRIVDLLREAWAVRHRQRLVSTAAMTLAPFMPVSLWQAIRRLRGKKTYDLFDWSAIHPDFARHVKNVRNAADMASGRMEYLHRDPRRLRARILEGMDASSLTAGAGAGWGLDMRDPTGDIRLLEFCLAIPEQQYLKNGQFRRLAHRVLDGVLPPKLLAQKTRGVQAADWYEGVVANPQRILDEVERLEDIPVAAESIDLARLRDLCTHIPDKDWNCENVALAYRHVLLRGICAGRFIRKIYGANT